MTSSVTLIKLKIFVCALYTSLIIWQVSTI